MASNDMELNTTAWMTMAPPMTDTENTGCRCLQAKAVPHATRSSG